jgi:hypothetical protein
VAQLVGNQRVRNRDIVAKRMTPAQIDEAQMLAREWKPKSTPAPPWFGNSGSRAMLMAVRRASSFAWVAAGGEAPIQALENRRT